MNLIVILVLVTAIIASVIGSIYRFLVRPIVREHFGEEHRRDFEARKRRRVFEGNIGSACCCVYFSSFARVMGELFPDVLQWIFWVISGLLLLVGLAFIYAAFRRWSEPFTD
jgi:hypothetical protein